MNQRITSETFRFKFLNYNRSWLINQLPSILTPRTLRRSRPYLINQFTRILNQLNQDISSDSDDGDAKFGDVALTAPSRQIIRKWLADARRRMRLAEVVQPLISKARGTQCEVCLSRKQLQVEVVTPLAELIQKYDGEHPDEEFDQVVWKTFWIKHQRYRTICLQCISKAKEEERRDAISGAAQLSDDDDGGADYPDWGPIYLSAASRAIVIGWYKQAQQRVFGRGGKRRKQVTVDVSDDEGDEPPSRFAHVGRVELSSSSHALAIRWLRTARSQMQRRAGKGGEGEGGLKVRRRRAGDKYKSGNKSKTRHK